MVHLLVKKPDDREYGRVLDGTLLSEILHPRNDPVGMNFSLAHAMLREGEASLPHRLGEAVEVYYILEGEGVMHIGEEVREVSAGDAVYIPPGCVQYIENSGEGDLSFLCIVSPPWRGEDEELVMD
ncbi:cupin domain-containing protein [Methanothermobacter sp. KEPCO-1]|uniref:cupin domain-containing protein n=1 Tax=Methanothermobacter sp. KEPCO-1 TaxID=2603820 RepID=UPI0011C979D3|nr:cupin domain-containing protein [Methanothermobacter sp. KEPCO-1]QEF95317.1 cupin domain-containing protein [Methanothermobacter sp. KEPCO-1]